MSNPLLNESIIQQVKDHFDKQLDQPVQVLYFGKQTDCDYCPDTHQLVEEVAALSDKIELQVYDLDADPETARKYQVERAPGLVIAGRDGDQVLDYGVRFTGVPAGYEFSSLIQSLVLVSKRQSGLSDQTKKALEGLKNPVDLLVFTTPT